MLQSMGSQTVGHYWMTELNWTECTGDNATLPVHPTLPFPTRVYMSVAPTFF